MFTQTHLLVGASVFARPHARATTFAGLVGALLPDSDVWLMFVIERSTGSTGCEIFHYRYWEQPWTSLQMALNSIPVYMVILGVGMLGLMASNTVRRNSALLLIAFATSALLHVGTDFLLHHEDARPHWMPLTGWIFRSPVSYWDPNHFGRVFAVFEIALAGVLIVVIGRRYNTKSIWAVLFVASLGYSASIAASFMAQADHPKGPGTCEAVSSDHLPSKAPGLAEQRPSSHALR